MGGPQQPTRLQLRGQHNALKRYRSGDDPDVLAIRTALKVASAESYIEELVNSAPALTPEQRDKLAVLLKAGAA